MGEKGRKPRTSIERVRTLIWAENVKVQAKRSFDRLSEVLGDDGRWNGMWSRYARGLVSPTLERIERIEHALPGTARYYFSPTWMLYEHREFRWSELRQAVDWLDPRLATIFVEKNESAGGKFWRVNFSLLTALELVSHLYTDQELALDAITMTMILIRDAELRQDGVAYLLTLMTWAKLTELRSRPPAIRYLPLTFLEAVVEPLRHMWFADPELEEAWNAHVQNFCEKYSSNWETFEIIYCLDSESLRKSIEKLNAFERLTRSLFM